MPNYVLDTGIVLGYFKETRYAQEIEATLKPFQSPNAALICVVTQGEVLSIALQNQWSETNRTALEELLNTFPTINISHKEIIAAYAEIDAFSQGKLRSKRLPTDVSSRNMGKNDLWISAATYKTNATLVTTDKDFDHLNGVYFPVQWFDPTKK